MSRGSLLVVDDERGMRDLLDYELADAGYAVTVAGDAAEAIAHLRRSDFDVVISDVRMPGMDGIALLDAIRELGVDSEVVLATAFATMETAIDALRRGAFDFVQKPFEVSVLLPMIARAVEHKALRSAAQLSAASHAIFTNEDPQRLPELIVDMAMKVLDADDVSLMVLDARGKLFIAHAQGLSKELQAEVSLEIGERVLGRVARAREPILLFDGIEKDARFAGVADHGRVRSSIIYPLVLNGSLLGVLNIGRVASKRAFQPRDLDRAAVVASQVLLALENVRLLRHMLSTDRLVSIGQVAAGVAHEINNPLAAILVNQSLLREGLNEVVAGERGGVGELHEILGDLEHSTSRILDIVRDLSALSRNDEHGRPSLFDLNDAIVSALRITAVATRGNISLETELTPGLTVLGIPGRISQVFVNLLVNASHALASCPVEHRVLRVSSRREADRVVAEVCDSGPGIAPEHLSRIFEPFFTTKERGRGTGLGLSISRDIVTACGGELRVQSVLGGGACFTLLLPTA